MAGPSFSWFDLFKKGQANGAHFVDFDSDTLKWTLHSALYVPDQSGDEFYTDVAHEFSTGGGYTAGGLAASSKTVTLTGGAVFYDQANPRWDPLTLSGIRIAVLRKDTGSGATSPLIAWVDLGSDRSPAGVPFELQLNSSGLFKWV